ncbi:MAG TPA: hypothetical protein VFC94_00395 [Bacteroidaceae bacterium]|nr:hypothetical protein [Bacteroidaceae bacterium]
MTRLSILLSIVLSLFIIHSAKAQEIDEQMINAQLRYIKEKAELTRREYQRFAVIYLEYNKALYELNRSFIPKNQKRDNFLNDMPLGIRFNGQSEDYYKKWNEINRSYIEKLEKQLHDSTRQKIGIAQWELGQRIWKEWSEKSRKNMERQIGMIRMIDQDVWRQNGFQSQSPFHQPQIQGQQRNFEEINKYFQDHPEERKRFEEQHKYFQENPEEFKKFQEQMELKRKENEERWKEMADQQKQWWENYWEEWNKKEQFRRENNRMHPAPKQQRPFPQIKDSDSVRSVWPTVPRFNMEAPESQSPMWNFPYQRDRSRRILR